MNIIKDASFTQRIGFALIFVSLLLGVIVVSQELANDIAYAIQGDYSNEVFLQPLQMGESLPNASGTLEPIDPAGTIISPTPTPLFQATGLPDQQPEGLIPDTLMISSIHLFAPVKPVHYKEVIIDGQNYLEWQVLEERAAGWHDTSARLGESGNLVLNGHHNTYGMVFSKLVDLKKGDLISIYSGTSEYLYEVDKVLILREEGLSNEVRAQNASWIAPTTDERLTLVSCWPPGNNTHRVIVVAFPVGHSPG